MVNSERNLKKRKTISLVLKLAVWLSGAFTVGMLLYILLFILIRGIPNINIDFLFGKYNSETLSAFSSIVTTIQMIVISLAVAVPIGVFCAIYLTEYAKRGNKVVKVIRWLWNH